MIKIKLNTAEQEVVKLIARERRKHAKENKLATTIYGGRNALMAEINYYGAELAFCKHYNVYPDLTIEEYKPQDSVVGGVRIDVKHTTRLDGRLLVKAKGWDDPPDYFALVTGKFPEYNYVGFLNASEVMREWRIDQSLPFPAYAVKQEELIQVK